MLARVDLRGSADLRPRSRARPRPGRRRQRRGGRDHRRRPRARRRRGARLHRAVRRLPPRRAARCRASELRRALDRLDPGAPRRARARARPDRSVARGAGRRGSRARRGPACACGSCSCRSTAPVATCRAAAAPLASSVLMTAIPARVAGVPHVALCTPPRSDGTVHDAILAAARLAEVDAVYRVGGAQAIAALAYGTDTIDAGRRHRRARQRVRRGGEAPGGGRRRDRRLRRPVGGRGGRRRRPSPPVLDRRRPARPGRARPGRLGGADHVVGGRWAPRSSASSTIAARRRAARRRHRSRAARRRAARARRRARAGDGRGQPDRARAPRADVRRRRGAWCRSCATPVRCSSGVDASAVIGDYVAGVNHVLPTGGTARFAGRVARRRLPQARARRVARPGRAPASWRRSSRRWPRPRVSPRTPTRSAAGSRRERARPAAGCSRATTCARSRDTTRRRSTCRSASTPTRARTRRRPSSSTRLHGRARARSRGTAIPTAAPPSSAPRSARSSASRRERLLCANGSNEVLQTLLLTYGGAGRRALLFEPTYALARADRAHDRDRGGRVGERDRRLHDRRRRAAAELVRGRRPSVVFVCSPNNPTGTVEPRATVERAARGRGRDRRAARGRRGLRRVRAVERARARRRRPAARRRAHLLEGLVAGRGAPRLRGRAARGSIAELEKVLLPYTLSVPTQIAGHGRARLPRARWSSGSRRSSRSAAGCSRRSPTCPASRSCRRARTSCSFRVDGDAHELWQRLARARRAGARLLVVAARRGLPARHGRHTRGERRIPRRAARGPAGGASV